MKQNPRNTTTRCLLITWPEWQTPTLLLLNFPSVCSSFSLLFLSESAVQPPVHSSSPPPLAPLARGRKHLFNLLHQLSECRHPLPPLVKSSPCLCQVWLHFHHSLCFAMLLCLYVSALEIAFQTRIWQNKGLCFSVLSTVYEFIVVVFSQFWI